MRYPILVMCPSRERPRDVIRMIVSFLRTSKRAKLAIYLDGDDHGDYRRLRKFKSDRIVFHMMARTGPVASANFLAHTHRDHEIYGFMCDDARFETLGWDEWLLRTAERFPGGVGMMSPLHDQGDRCDFPYVTRGWIDAAGWYAFPDVKAWAWPLVSTVLGEATTLVHAERHEFFIHHIGTQSPWVPVIHDDRAAFYNFMMTGYYPVLRRLRAAQNTEVELGTGTG